ncbi:2-dehydropantoate 2-reductase [soil metagenome]
MTEPRVLVVGCGAIGSLFAAHLARAGVEVWGFDVSQAHVDAITRDGLQVDSHEGEAGFTARFEARTNAGDIPSCELAIVAVKAEHTRAAMTLVAPVLTDAAVASVQNGIGNEEVIAGFAPRVIRGSTLIAGAIPAPGHVRLDALGDTWLGPFEPKPASLAEVQWLADALTGGGMTTHGLADARGAQWTKLLFNAATNALCALTGLTTGQLTEVPGLKAMVHGLMREGRQVAAELGIVLDTDPQVVMDDAVARAYYHRPSMLQDVTARRRTEVDVLNGGVVVAAREVGVSVPLHEAVVGMVHGLERSWAETVPGISTP